MNDIEKRLEILEKRIKALEDSTSNFTKFENTVNKPQDRLSVNEFLNTKKLGDDVKRTLAIAYWLDYFEKEEGINASDIVKVFRSARYKAPININDKINMNVKNGHLAEEKEKKNGKKAWYVTNSGAQYVEENLNKNS